MRAFVISAGVAASLALLAAGCARQATEQAEPRPSFGQLRLQLESHFDGCTQTYGTDPRGTQNVGDYELVPNERAWLDCAYQGIETIMLPNTGLPQMYRSFIAESRSLTDLLERREVTRAQRRSRLLNLIAEIEDAEIARLVEGEPGMSEDQQRKNKELVRNTFDNFRDMVVPPRRVR